MTEKSKKSLPPYATYQSFFNFINGLRENGMPKHITRSVVPGSNSGKASMMASLTAMGLINEKEEPTQLMKQLADPEKDYGEVLGRVLQKTYPFFSDGSLDLGDTTTDKVVEKIKEYGANGSTITKCMSFLLAAAKDSNVSVSRYVKTPPPPTRSKPAKKKSKIVAPVDPVDEDDREEPGYPTDKERIVVSVHGMDEWEIFVPKDLTQTQWKHGLKMAKFILDNYRPSDEPSDQEPQ